MQCNVSTPCWTQWSSKVLHQIGEHRPGPIPAIVAILELLRMLVKMLPGLVETENEGRPGSAAEKAGRQVSGAIENAQHYAQAVIQTLTTE